MTFDMNEVSHLDGIDLDYSILTSMPMKAVAEKSELSTNTKEETKEISYESFQKARWEDEGGAYADFSNHGNCDDGGNVEGVQTLLDKAQSHFESDDIDNAVIELIAAGERLKSHHEQVQTSVNKAIGKLTTMGCPASPPHPKALSLIKFRRTLPA